MIDNLKMVAYGCIGALVWDMWLRGYALAAWAWVYTP